MTIGFIGQGWIGKNYADDFEKRGYSVVRYSLEEPHVHNKDKIHECDIVFIAVPTPTTPEGFDASVVEGALSLIGDGKTAVIKSTILPGTTFALQKKYPAITLTYSPEFLSEATAAYDCAHPFSNIVGVAANDDTHHTAAQAVLEVLPIAPFSQICTSTEAEFIKYAHNLNGYFQIQLANVLYDAAQKLGAEWEPVRTALEADPFISNRYSKPVHKTGRGAGGHCFIKDFAAFARLYEAQFPEDIEGIAVLTSLEKKNIKLLKATGKDLELLRGVYGADI